MTAKKRTERRGEDGEVRVGSGDVDNESIGLILFLRGKGKGTSLRPEIQHKLDLRKSVYMLFLCVQSTASPPVTRT